jgi:putative oxidoreductase
MSYGILLLRVVVGLTMAAHGTQKLLGWFGGGGLSGTSGFLSSLGFRSSRLMALLSALGETMGLLFAAGFLTPLASLAIIVVMTTAVITVHAKNGFFSGNGGFEYNLVLVAVATAVAAAGPGRFSIDRLIGWDGSISGLWWAVGVVVAALAIGALNVALFRHTTPQPVWAAASYGEGGLAPPPATRSGCPDSNWGPLRPERSALPGCATPRANAG